jgi:hypothetical protein
MTILKRMWNDKVSLLLFIYAIFITIGFFTKDLNLPFEGAFALYILFQVNERGVFFDKLRENFPEAAEEMGVGPKRKFKQSTFTTIVNIIILLGFSYLLYISARNLIF